MVEEIPADIRQRKAARRALDQPHAEPLLQFRHALADGRFRNAEMVSCRREAAAFHRLHEKMEVVEVEGGHVHLPCLWTLRCIIAIYCLIVHEFILAGSTIPMERTR